MSRPDDEVYTHTHSEIVLDAHGRRTAEEAAAFLLAHLRPGMRLLDLGCGPGSITIGLARYVAPAETVGIDQAEEALESARKRATDHSMSHVRFERADVYELPFGDDEFDVVYAHQLLQHLADPVAGLTEAHRVLRPGGYVAVRDSDYGTMTHYPHEPMLDVWLERYHRTARGNGGEPDAGRRLMEWVRAAGFEHLHATTSTWLFATPEDRSRWAGLWTSRRLRNDDRSSSEDAAIREAFHRWAEHPDGWFSFIHGEVLARKAQ